MWIGGLRFEKHKIKACIFWFHWRYVIWHHLISWKCIHCKVKCRIFAQQFQIFCWFTLFLHRVCYLSPFSSIWVSVVPWKPTCPPVPVLQECHVDHGRTSMASKMEVSTGKINKGPMAPFGYQVEYQDTKKTQIWKHFFETENRWWNVGVLCWGQYFLNLSNKKQHYQRVTWKENDVK